jgi:hypothetical protein
MQQILRENIPYETGALRGRELYAAMLEEFLNPSQKQTPAPSASLLLE